MKRILLKLSGEALAGDKKTGFDEATVIGVAKQVKKLVDDGMQVCIVIGGGNFWRGRSSQTIDRTKADQIGMLATVMNCIYVSEIFRYVGMKTQIFTPFECGTMTKLFSKDACDEVFGEGHGDLLCRRYGTSLFFHGYEHGAAGHRDRGGRHSIWPRPVDGVYDSDPKMNPEAKKYDEVSIQEVIDKKLQVVDMTASIMCMENQMPMLCIRPECRGQHCQCSERHIYGNQGDRVKQGGLHYG